MREHDTAHEETDETGLTLRIVADGDSAHLDPTEDDEAIIMAVLSHHYNNPAKERVLIRDDSDDSDEDYKGTAYTFKDKEGLALFESEMCKPEGEWAAFPLYMYEHGNTLYQVSQNGNPFSDPWDSCRVGTLFIHKPDIGPDGPYKAAQVMCEVYTSWANGEVYGYTITNSEGDTVDSCWGFIGPWDSYVLEEGRRALASAAKDQKEEDAKREAEEAIAEAARAKQAAQDAADLKTVRTYLFESAPDSILDAFIRLHPIPPALDTPSA